MVEMKRPGEIWSGFRQLLTTPTPHVDPTKDITQSMISAPEPDAEKSQGSPPRNDAPLENLPAEIRRYLLFTLNYEELKALINASPIYHQQYRLDRRGLRPSCMERTLGNISADAYAVYQSGIKDFIEACNPKSVAHLMDSYEENLSLSHYSFLTELTMDEIMSMFSFHISIVMPLARSFTTWALNNLASIRMSTLPTLIMVIEDIITRPLRQRRLISIGNGIGIFFLGGTISRGIKLLHHVLFEVQDHAQLVSVMRDNIEFSPGCFQDNYLDDATQQVRNQQLQDLGAGWRGPPPFQGDSENQAPLAWALTWEHFFTDWLLVETSLDIRRWGHMIWDAARLERTGGKEVLIRKHEERWKGQEWDASEWV